MNKPDDQKLRELKELQNSFRNSISILKKTKTEFIKLFKKRLEEEKIKELKNSLQ